MTQKQTGGSQGETVLRKYPNRRIYDATRNTHVTLAEIADRVKAGERIRILDHKTGEDLTQVTMGQVLVETLKSRPDYLPLDLVTLMIRAQDNVVRDFLYNGLPQAFQGYLEHQRRMMSGMMMQGWMPGGFPTMNPFGTFFGGGSQTPQPPQSAQQAGQAQPSFSGAPSSQPGSPGANPPGHTQTPNQFATPPQPQPAGHDGDDMVRDELLRLRKEIEALKQIEKGRKSHTRKK